MFNPIQIAEWCAGTWRPAPPPCVGGVSHDTRAMNAEDLYVAIRGERFDGHSFVPDAFAAGAAGCLVDSGYANNETAAPLLVVEDTRIALARLAAGYRADHDARIIGVTGSAGKTTVVAMVAGVVSQVLPTAMTRGNWNNDIGLPLSILSMEPSDEIGVFEVASNHPGEIAALSEILKPELGVVTNIGPAHMEFFQDLESVADEKSALLEALPADGTAIIAADRPHAERLREAAPGPVVTVASSGNADYTTTLPDPDGWVEIAERSSAYHCRIRLPLPGEHTAINAAMAIAVTRLIGIPWEAIEPGIESFVPGHMRWETVDVDGVSVINDAYNANPLSMRAALQAFDALPVSGRKWIVLGDMCELGELEREAHAELGRQIAKSDWEHLVTVGERGAWIGQAAQSVNSTSIRVRTCAGSDEAAAILRSESSRGDAVLLKASRAVQLESIIDLLLA